MDIDITQTAAILGKLSCTDMCKDIVPGFLNDSACIPLVDIFGANFDPAAQSLALWGRDA